MDDARKSLRNLENVCTRIRSQVIMFHGRRVPKVEATDDTITLTPKQVFDLMSALAEVEKLVQEGTERLSNVEVAMLTHLHHTLDNPAYPEASTLVSRTSEEQDELRKLENDTGTGPGRKHRATIVHSLTQ